MRRRKRCISKHSKFCFTSFLVGGSYPCHGESIPRNHWHLFLKPSSHRNIKTCSRGSHASSTGFSIQRSTALAIVITTILNCVCGRTDKYHRVSGFKHCKVDPMSVRQTLVVPETGAMMMLLQPACSTMYFLIISHTSIRIYTLLSSQKVKWWTGSTPA
jgi:hypothetical protein